MAATDDFDDPHGPWTAAHATGGGLGTDDWTLDPADGTFDDLEWSAPDPTTHSDLYLVSPPIMVGSGPAQAEVSHAWSFDTLVANQPPLVGTFYFDGGTIEVIDRRRRHLAAARRQAHGGRLQRHDLQRHRQHARADQQPAVGAPGLRGHERRLSGAGDLDDRPVVVRLEHGAAALPRRQQVGRGRRRLARRRASRSAAPTCRSRRGRCRAPRCARRRWPTPAPISR